MTDRDTLWRALGRRGRGNSRLAMGSAKLGAFWQGRSLQDGVRAVRLALDSGVSLVDTADCYARGIAEHLIGRALGDRRDDIVVCTKAGLLKTPVAQLQARNTTPRGNREAWTLHGLGRKSDASRCYDGDFLIRRLDISLRRLRTESVDIFYLHEPSSIEIAQGRHLEGVQRILDAGKARLFGVSCNTLAAAQTALRDPLVSVIQVPYSFDHQAIVRSIWQEAASKRVALIGAAPLGDGRLLASCPRSDVEEAAASALRFALDSAALDYVLVGMSQPGHVEKNVNASRSTVSDLDHENLRKLSATMGGSTRE